MRTLGITAEELQPKFKNNFRTIQDFNKKYNDEEESQIRFKIYLKELKSYIYLLLIILKKL